MRLVFAIILTFLVSNAHALPVRDFYEVNIPKSVAKDAQLFQSGLNEVLSRMTGLNDFTYYPGLQTALLEADHYVQRYRIEQGNMLIQYDPERLFELLEGTGVSYLGENRPITMMWIATENRDGRRQIINAANLEIVTLVDALNKEHGLAFNLPLMDLEDVTSVSVTDIHPNFADRLTTASARYGADVWIGVKLGQQDDESWVAEWMMYTPSQLRKMEFRGLNPADMIKAGAHLSARAIVEDYGVASRQTKQAVHIQIDGIRSIKEYAQVMHYIKGLDVVSDAIVERTLPNQLMLNIDAMGGHNAFTQAIRIDDQLMATDEGHYRWIPS